MKIYEFRDARTGAGIDDLDFAMNSAGLWTPERRAIYPGHSDWVGYSKQLIEEGSRPAILGKAGSDVCGSCVFDQSPADNSIIEIKYLWMSPDERGRGVGLAIVALSVGEISRIWPECRLVTANAKASNVGVRKLAERSGFRPVTRQIIPSIYGTNGEPDITYVLHLNKDLV